MKPEPGQFSEQEIRDANWAKDLMGRGGDLPDTNQARERMGVFAKGTSKAGDNVRVVAREGDRNAHHYPYNPTYNENMGKLNRLRGTGKAAELAAKNASKPPQEYRGPRYGMVDVPKPKAKVIKIKSGGAGGFEEK